jgi:hypothetical protein
MQKKKEEEEMTVILRSLLSILQVYGSLRHGFVFQLL